jgi:hypothetical protein
MNFCLLADDEEKEVQEVLDQLRFANIDSSRMIMKRKKFINEKNTHIRTTAKF